MDKLYTIVFIFQLIGIGISSFYLIRCLRMKQFKNMSLIVFSILFYLSVFSVFFVASDFQIIPLFIKNISALLFYVIIITTPPYLFNFLVSKIDSSRKTHTKVFYISYVLFLINIISYLYLTFKPGTNFFHVVIENLMNYSNFATYIFVFPIITFYYFFQILKIILKFNSQESDNKSIKALSMGYFLFIFLHLIVQFNSTILPLHISFLIYILIYTSLMILVIIKESKKDLDNELRIDFKEKYFNEISLKLNQVIEEERPYLDSKLTIYQLAKKIDSNEKYLSHYLNCVHEVNFYTYINNFRIEEAKKLLLSEEAENYTIETIAKMAGFHSKSSFNSAFKKSTDLTPSEFRKIILIE